MLEVAEEAGFKLWPCISTLGARVNYLHFENDHIVRRLVKTSGRHCIPSPPHAGHLREKGLRGRGGKNLPLPLMAV